MPIRFSGLTLPGKVLKGYRADSPELGLVRDDFPAVDGEVETRLGRRGRNILIPMIVYDRVIRTYDVAFGFLNLLDIRLSEPKQGMLEIEVGYGSVERYPNCSFQAYERLSDILPDVGLGLGAGIGTYFFHVLLVFRQHAYEV